MKYTNGYQNGIDHIHIFSKNLENTVDFFSNMLGSKWIGPIEIPQANIRTSFSDDGMEVVQSTGPDKDGVAPFLESHGPGIGSVGFRVPDIEKAISRFEKNGVTLISRGSYTFRPEVDVKSAAFTADSAHGVPLELVEFGGMTPIGLASSGWVSKLPWINTANKSPGNKIIHSAKINHLNLFQNNLEKSVRFFSPIFQCNWIGPFEIPELNLKIAYSDVGINIFQPDGEDSLGIYNYIQKYGEGVGSLGIKVFDRESAISELESQGVHLLGKFNFCDTKSAYFNPDDSHGVMLELVEFQDVTPVGFGNLNLVRKLPWMKI